MPEAKSLYPDAWERFGRILEQRGFACVDHPYGKWEGDLQVAWLDPDSSQEATDTHHIAITLDSGFPFRKPEVTCLTPLRAGARHRAPVGTNEALCLYSERAQGWLPEYTADDLLDRVRDWFIHYHRDDWSEEDRPPDLHLYYQRAARRHLAVIGEGWQPPDGLAGRFGMWEGTRSVIMACATSGDTLPTGGPPQELSDNLGTRTSGYSVGTWFRLNAEPTPSQTLAEVFEDIDAKVGAQPGFAQRELRKLVGIKPKREVRTIIALGYPAPSGVEEWLFLDVILPVGSRRANRWERQLSQIRVRSLETAPARSSDLMRRAAHVQERLATKRVLVFGLGAIGSTMALLLAKSGVSAIDAVDSQQLRPTNCVRHEAGLRMCGFDKASAVGVVVGQHAPYCQYNVHHETWNPAKLQELAEEADLIIDATANETFGLLVNEICIQVQRKLLTVASYRRSSVGRTRIVSPGQNACLVCYRRHLEEDDYPIIPPGEEGEFVEAGCGDPTVEASAIDVELVATNAAKIAQNLLSGAWMPGSDECLFIVEPIQDARTPLNVGGAHWFQRRRIAGCGSCGSL